MGLFRETTVYAFFQLRQQNEEKQTLVYLATLFEMYYEYTKKWIYRISKRPPPQFDSFVVSDALWTLQHQASKVRTRRSVAAFFPCSTKFAYCKRRLNAAETGQQGYEYVTFLAPYSFLHCRAGLDEATMPWQLTLHPGWAFERG